MARIDLTIYTYSDKKYQLLLGDYQIASEMDLKKLLKKIKEIVELGD